MYGAQVLLHDQHRECDFRSQAVSLLAILTQIYFNYGSIRNKCGFFFCSWSLERRCANNCEAGCIVIGERTKLYACTDCCNSSYCNSGKGASAPPLFVTHNCIILAVTVLHCLHRYMYFDWIYAAKTKMPHIVAG